MKLKLFCLLDTRSGERSSYFVDKDERAFSLQLHTFIEKDPNSILAVYASDFVLEQLAVFDSMSGEIIPDRSIVCTISALKEEVDNGRVKQKKETE